MSILEELGGSVSNERLLLGRVSRIDGDYVYAVLPSFNSTHEFGPMRFEHAASIVVGASVLVGFDEFGSAWIVSWDGVPIAIDFATQSELDAHTSLTTTAHGGIVASTDARLTNARTPTAHAASHAAAGGDPVTLAESQITGLVSDLAAKAPLASPALTGTPTAPTATGGTSTTQVATTAFVAAAVAAQPVGGFVPIGGYLPFAGSAAPTGYLLCDGASYTTAAQAALFAVIGYTYGGSGANFNVPNLKGRIPVGRDAADASFDVLGETGGAKTHALSIAELATHTHVQNSHTHSIAGGTAHFYTTGGSPWVNVDTAGAGLLTVTTLTDAATPTNQNTGSGTAHNNLQPYLVTNYIIRAS